MYKIILIALLATVGITGCKSTGGDNELYPCCFVYGYNYNQYGPKEQYYNARMVGEEYDKAVALFEYVKDLSKNRKISDQRTIKVTPTIEFFFFKDKNKREKFDVYIYDETFLRIPGNTKLFVISPSELRPIMKFVNKIHEKYGDKPNYKIKIREEYDFTP